jgi:hypothetical protein
MRPMACVPSKQLTANSLPVTKRWAFKAHLFGRRLSSHGETNQQKRPTRQHPVPLPNQMPINVLFTITFVVELLGEPRTWLTYSMPAARGKHRRRGYVCRTD